MANVGKVGARPGDIELLTLKAIRVLAVAAVLLIDRWRDGDRRIGSPRLIVIGEVVAQAPAAAEFAMPAHAA